MDKCYLTIKFNPKNVKNNENYEYFINFCEDLNISKPQFIKNGTGLHTIQSRWVTPCHVDLDFKKENYYKAYYHPLVYHLAKNKEFKRIIIENAIESICFKKKLISELNYDIIENNCENSSSTPRYEISLFSSSFSQQKFIQLFIWLPLIISSNSIIIETCGSNFYLQTEKPHKYELNLILPDEFQNVKICFCNFLKKEKQLIIVGKYRTNFINDDKSLVDNLEKYEEFSDKENKSPPVLNQSNYLSNETLSSVSSVIDTVLENDNTGNVMCEIYYSNSNDLEQKFAGDQSISSQETELSVSFNEKFIDQKLIKSNVKFKKNHKVQFNSINSCLLFQESKPVSELCEKSEVSVPMKTNDGSSAKKFNYHQNKNQKNCSEKSNKSARSKRNSNKKKK